MFLKDFLKIKSKFKVKTLVKRLLHQQNGLKNKMLFSPKLLFFKDISKAICNLVLFVILEGTNSTFKQNADVFFKYLLL